MPGTLYLVATPIGNLQDISLRAIETLRNVDVIACEDTRHTRKLLSHYQISNKLVSYHEHNEAERAEEIARLLKNEKSVAIVSDAGTPGIADPGFRAVLGAIEMGIKIVSIPGAAAFVNATVISGLPTDAIFFGGFLPSKKGDRKRRLEATANIHATLVFYEAPHRLAASLADCAAILGERKAAVVREMTKLHEEIIRGSLGDLSVKFANANVKGEIVIVIDRDRGQRPDGSADKTLAERVAEIEAEGIDSKSALKQAAREYGIGKSEAYRLMQNRKNN